jgi:pyruvate formate lyase activating enzyme
MVLTEDAESQTGLIFNIQRFSVHDGPGIRTTVFMKGCPLSCLWCSNPESQAFEPELIIRDAKCTGCGSCIPHCKENAITINAKGKRKTDRTKCLSCFSCLDACKFDAIESCGRLETVENIVEEILRDKLFYKNSGGGVTVSGGEPLMQSKFVSKLLRVCKEEGLHTVIDTTGHAPWHSFQQVLPWTDLILFDIKHLSSDEHLRTTGVENQRVLENLRRVSGMTRIWLRVPLIAGYNDSEEHILSIATLAKEIGAEKISLLPYHEGGRAKSQQIGRTYQLIGARPPGEPELEALGKIITKQGIEVGFGN